MAIGPTLIDERSTIVVVASVISKKTDRVFPFEARLDHEACGLDLPSKAQVNQLRAIDKRRVLGAYGVADARTMAGIDAAIRVATGLDPL